MDRKENGNGRQGKGRESKGSGKGTSKSKWTQKGKRETKVKRRRENAISRGQRIRSLRSAWAQQGELRRCGLFSYEL